MNLQKASHSSSGDEFDHVSAADDHAAVGCGDGADARWIWKIKIILFFILTFNIIIAFSPKYLIKFSDCELYWHSEKIKPIQYNFLL